MVREKKTVKTRYAGSHACLGAPTNNMRGRIIYRFTLCAVVILLRFRNEAGMALNSLGPLTGNEISRRFLAIVGALVLALGTLHNLPLLGSK